MPLKVQSYLFFFTFFLSVSVKWGFKKERNISQGPFEICIIEMSKEKFTE